jgi:hypothetical protein
MKIMCPVLFGKINTQKKQYCKNAGRATTLVLPS